MFGRADNSQRSPHVVVIGAGFGGLYAVRAMRSLPVRVSLIDRRNHHLFQPLLYQVAAAMLNPSDIAAPIRSILARQRNVDILLAEAKDIRPAERMVVLGDDTLSYDYLILATGATHSYFGHPEWARHALGLKTIEDALAIRRKVLLAFEAAERERDPERRRAWMTFVVVGGGPTGVELAGALAEIAHRRTWREFRRIDTRRSRVLLLEGLDRILPAYPRRLSDEARRQLERLGVEVRTGCRVTAVSESGVEIGEERIESRTVLWAAGVQASPLGKALGVPLDSAGRVLVEADLSIPGHPEVFVIGDLAHFEQEGHVLPGVAPVAIQQGRHVAENLGRDLEGRPRRPFRYRDRGSFATIGRGAAVGLVFGRWEVVGPPAWLAWLAIHIFFLIGFRNRFFTLCNWAYHYLTFRRGARLITETEPSEVG